MDPKGPRIAERPWGDDVGICCPDYHFPTKIGQIDENTGVGSSHQNKTPPKITNACEEMKEAVNKISELLNNISTRAGKRNVKSTNDPSANSLRSCIDSLTEGVTLLSSDLKRVNENQSNPNMAVKEQIMRNSPTTELNAQPESPDSGISVGTHRSRCHSCDTSEVPLKASTRRRYLSSSSSSSGISWNETRRSANRHKSNFRSIAGLCGYEDAALHKATVSPKKMPPRKIYDSLMTAREPTTSDRKYYTEYPPQEGGSTFMGIFADDIAALQEEAARGLIIF